jgi:hypothetical protein
MKGMKLEQFCRFRRHLYATLVCCALLALTHAASASTENASTGKENSLLGELREVFQKRNPAIEHVAILDLKALYYNLGGCVFVGWGIRGDQMSHDDANNELYGVFVADSKLTRITQVLEIMKTPRWQDYGLFIETLTADSVVIVGRGLTYGDQRIRRVYAWQRVRPNAPPFVPRASSNSAGDDE